MLRYVTKRLSRLVPVLLIVTFFSFLLLGLTPETSPNNSSASTQRQERCRASRRLG